MFFIRRILRWLSWSMSQWPLILLTPLHHLTSWLWGEHDRERILESTLDDSALRQNPEVTNIENVKPIAEIKPHVPDANVPRELLMVGMSAMTYRVGDIIRKECHILSDDTAVTEQNMEACKTEAEVYLILGSHPLIARCLSIGPEKEYLELEYYPNGDLKQHIQNNQASITEMDLKRWARQMIESVAYIHAKGVRHSDIRLDQWLVDRELNALLSDFNASGFDEQPGLALKGRLAQGLELSSHYLPRDPGINNTTRSDIFALGSALYELTSGKTPYEGLPDESITALFEEGMFPKIEGLLLGDIIMGCWKQEFVSCDQILLQDCFYYEQMN